MQGRQELRAGDSKMKQKFIKEMHSNPHLSVNNTFFLRGDQIPYLIQEEDRISYILIEFHANLSITIGRTLKRREKNFKSRFLENVKFSLQKALEN